MIQLSKELLGQVVGTHDVNGSEPINKIERGDLDKFVDPLGGDFRCCRKGLISTSE